MTGVTRAATSDVCLSRFCLRDNDATCDRKFEKCPVCLSLDIKVIRCTSPTLGFCSVLGFGDKKCNVTWEAPDNPENPTTAPVETTEAPTTTVKPIRTTAAPTTTRAINTTTAVPTTTKASVTTKPTTTPVATSALEVPTTQPTTTAPKQDDAGTGAGWITYAGIGVGAAVVIAFVALLVLRMKRREEDDEDDEISSYKQPTAAEQAQYNPYSNNNNPPPSEQPAVAASNLRANLDPPTSQVSDNVPGGVAAPAAAAAVVTEGPRQKSVHTDVWGNVPSSYRENDVASYSGNDSFLSDGSSLRRTGNSASGDGKIRDNETRLSVEF
ncbi:hypothetical protein B5M09_012155 [Aphanomyces astaci]|uniref:Uncharacterized protein n=1 Tax=Aphanomyces astaci TaxID=112090 RepID=A0A3R7X6Y5_APHAT|nr:hypothetical protein B5M09_012155 [Aphanomyces astaci]